MDNLEIQSKTMGKSNCKKVGILTYHNPDNYGAVLQTLALVEQLKRMGLDVCVIDYTTQAHLNAYNFFRLPTTLKSFLNIVLGLPNYFRLKRRHQKFAVFREERFSFTHRYADKEEFLHNLPQVDTIIVGSDQVFQVWEDKEISVYYLPFYETSIKKIAYAPSFGRSVFTPAIDAKIKKTLTDFNKLSCREEIGAQHIHELTGKECLQVVDPVLLIGKDFWTSVAESQNDYEKPYILIFDLLGGSHLVNLAKQLNKGKGLKIVCITTKRFLKRPYFVDKLIWDASPLEFVGWFRNASYIVTDSFHGSAFATIFSKPLVCLIVNERASDRLETLLSYFGAKEKLLSRKKISDGIDVNNYLIDTRSTRELDKAINISRNYLKNAISEV